MNAADPVEAYLAHLSVERQGSAHTLDAYRRDLAALQVWSQGQGRDLMALDQLTPCVRIAPLIFHHHHQRAARAQYAKNVVNR